MTFRPSIEIGKRRGRPALLRAGNGMGGNEAGEAPGQMAPRVGDDVALGAAGVGHHRLRREMRRDPAHDGGHLPDRRREQHEIGALDRERGIARRLVDHAQLERGGEVRARAPDADDELYRARALQRERERAADQPDADDDELVDFQFSCHLELIGVHRRSSAAHCRSACLGVSRRDCRSTRKRLRQRLEEPLVLLRARPSRAGAGACRSPRSGARSRRARGAAGTRSAPSPTSTLTKLPNDGMNSRPSALEALRQLAHAGPVQLVAPAHELRDRRAPPSPPRARCCSR